MNNQDKYLVECGIHSQWDLLEIAESANPPDNLDEHVWTEKTFDSSNGWKVVFFYDGDELDYIDTFISPDGTVINFWEWGDGHPWFNDLFNWRCVGDLVRLKESDIE